MYLACLKKTRRQITSLDYFLLKYLRFKNFGETRSETLKSQTTKMKRKRRRNFRSRRRSGK